MITIEQCRAARGLLGWTQGDLALACGLSKTAINNFEMGRSDIKNISLAAIRKAFEARDIEFLNGSGLKKRSETFSVLRGEGAFEMLLGDIVASLKGFADPQGSEVLAMNVDDRFMRKTSPTKVLEYLQELEAMGVTQRVLCAPGYDSILGPPHNCRWIERDSVHLTHMAFVYADKIAWPLWGENMILIMQSRDMQGAEAERFDFIWKNAQTASSDGQKVSPQSRKKA